MKILLSLFCLLFFNSFAQVENSSRVNYINPSPGFFYDILNFKSGDTTTTRIEVQIQVPFSKIQFIKTDKEIFKAEYYLTVSVYDENKKNLITEKTWSEKVETAQFSQTISSQNFNISLRTFNLKPAKYFFKLSLEDKDTRRTINAETDFVVRDLNTNYSPSDIILISSQTEVAGVKKIIPNITRNISSPKEGFTFYYEIYSLDTAEINIQYNVINEKKAVIYSKYSVRKLSAGVNPIEYKIDSLQADLGDYSLSINIQDSDFNILFTTNKPFVSRLIGIPSTISDLDKAVEQLIYIAETSDIDRIKSVKSYADRMKEFIGFWDERDPTPNTEENELFDEYYRRIAYTNKNFSHYMEGWRTDMGMVYIILGAPNNVDRHPFEYNTKPYEIWYYYELNKSFVFVDATGFGDYRLATPLYGDSYRFR